ncbi:MAG: NAD-dependent epimerase/dehydratase family protein, partial [Acidimicrobiia bacterium]
IQALGVSVVRGDLIDPASVDAAVAGCDGVFHSAALVSSATLTMEAAEAVNVQGTLTLLDAARRAGVRRVVAIGTGAAFDGSTTLTERSNVVPADTPDPYAASKRGAFLATMSRFEQGQDVVVVLPGGTYGPCPVGKRSIESFGMNQRLVRALRGEPAEYLPARMPWSCTIDVAGVSIAAFERGIAGHRYLGLGAPDCDLTAAQFVNVALELAGLSHRVTEVPADRLNDLELLSRFVPTVVERAKTPSPVPSFDASVTSQELGYTFVPTIERIRTTVQWMQSSDLV